MNDGILFGEGRQFRRRAVFLGVAFKVAVKTFDFTFKNVRLWRCAHGGDALVGGSRNRANVDAIDKAIAHAESAGQLLEVAAKLLIGPGKFAPTVILANQQAR